MAQVELSALLAEREQESAGIQLERQLLIAQTRFYRFCRLAEHRLTVEDAAEETGPGGQTLPAWLAELRERNRRLATAQGFEKLRDHAEREAAWEDTAEGARSPATLQPTPELPSQRGTRTCWQPTEANAAPGLQLTALEKTWTWSALVLGGLVLLLVAALGVLLRFSGRTTWPEQLALLGILGLLLFRAEWTLAFGLLPAFALAARAFLASRWLLAALSHGVLSTAPSASTTTSPKPDA